MFSVSIFSSLQKQIGAMKNLAKAKGRSKTLLVKRIDKIETQIKDLRMEQAALVLEIEMAEASATALENILRSGKEVRASVN